MTPATRPPARRDDVRLLAIDPDTGALRDRRFGDLPQLLRPGDLVVVNDAATLPASLRGIDDRGRAVELRLLGRRGEDGFDAVAFGAGSWRDATEDRPAPTLAEGSRIAFGDQLSARVGAASAVSPRLVTLHFDRAGPALLAAIYRVGRAVQYSYVERELALWDVQTVYGVRPWASEMPSAGRPLTGAALLSLRRRGVQLAAITHAAGLSSTGEAHLDGALPLPERYDVPAHTVHAIADARERGGRVVAIGTTVVRALEGNARNHGGGLRAHTGETDLVVDAAFAPRVVDGLVSGMHAPSESHFQLLRAFASERVLMASWRHAKARGYRCHEFGDASLVLGARA